MGKPAIDDGFPGLVEAVTPKPIHLHLILDISPSMITRWPQTLSGLNEYTASLRKDQADNEQPYKVTMTTFSADVNTPYKDVELDSIPTFTEKNLSPNGSGTALYDAIGETIKAINDVEPVLVVIITDGEENSSHTWNEKAVSQLMDDREKLGNYTYAYLGISKEAWGNAARMGATVAGSNRTLDASMYNSSLYAGTADSLSTMTATYSSDMRSNSARGLKMSKSNFFSATPDPVSKEDATDADTDSPVLTTTTGK